MHLGVAIVACRFCSCHWFCLNHAPFLEAIAGDHDLDIVKLQMQKKAWADFVCEIAAAVCETSWCMLQVGNMFAPSV